LLNTGGAAQIITADTMYGINIQEILLTDNSEITFDVYSDGTSPIKATIVWNDPAPSSSISPVLTNDLDLRISDENSIVFKPYILDPQNPQSPATTGDDTYNNVEKIIIDNPNLGKYTVSITSKNPCTQMVSVVISGVTNEQAQTTLKAHQFIDGSQTEVDSIARYETNDFVKYPAGILFNDVHYQDTVYLQSTLNNVYDQSNQSHKFLKWVETNITYTNYYPSVIENIEKETTSILAQSVYSNINSTIEGVLNYSTNLYFKDPWFRDKYDLKGWNNRGMEAVWHEGTNFDLSLDSEYQGVIIDQDFTIQNLPVYSIKTTSPQFVNINGTSNKIYFQKWECNPVGSVTFEDSHTLESSVTFHQDNSEVKAVFKGTDLTEDVYAIDNNSQSKIIRIGSGANDDLYKVYESLDCVWLEKSTNN